MEAVKNVDIKPVCCVFINLAYNVEFWKVIGRATTKMTIMKFQTSVDLFSHYIKKVGVAIHIFIKH